MKHGSTKTTSRFGTFLGICAALALGTVATRADAADTGNHNVAWLNFSTTALAIQIGNGTNLYAKLDAGAGCAAYNRTSDQLKSWLSIAQASFLSGKRVNINYNSCGGSNQINAITMLN